MPFEIELGWQVKAAMRSLNPFELGEVNAAINRLRHRWGTELLVVSQCALRSFPLAMAV